MELTTIANEIRKTVLSMVFKAQTSHIGSNFSCIDILTSIYAKADPKKDELVVSKGWVAASVYALNVKYGYMPQEAVDTFCDGTSPYIGLIEPLNYFGCKIGTGSMGLGFPSAVGLALAKKLKGEEGTVYCLMSDAEQAIGTTWESALIAAQHKLDNLVVIVDKNGFSAMGKTEDILNIDPLEKKWEAFGWSWNIVDGHDCEYMSKAFANISIEIGKPTIHIANTTKGKGVSFMENNNLYHYKQLSEEEYNEALACLK